MDRLPWDVRQSPRGPLGRWFEGFSPGRPRRPRRVRAGPEVRRPTSTNSSRLSATPASTPASTSRRPPRSSPSQASGGRPPSGPEPARSSPGPDVEPAVVPTAGVRRADPCRNRPGRSRRRRRPAWLLAREDFTMPRESAVAPRHPRRHQPAQAARPTAPHAPGHRVALRRRQRARRPPSRRPPGPNSSVTRRRSPGAGSCSNSRSTGAGSRSATTRNAASACSPSCGRPG